ncbi:MAG: hypothetical protein Kow0042_06740 [Calditrichia bacterium]
MRPYLMFVPGTAGLVGLAFIPHLSTASILLIFAVFFLSYGFGQTFTDCFQTDTDALSSPYRPLVQGKIFRTAVLTVRLSGLLIGVGILSYFNRYILLPGLLAVFGLAPYTHFKRTWWGGPPWNSWIVALLVIIARMSEPGSDLMIFRHPANPQYAGLWAATAMAFFAYLNFVVMGYFKDISADRATGYQTFPVVFGWKANAIYSDVAALLAAGCTYLALKSLPTVSFAGMAIFFLATGINLHAQISIHRICQEHLTHRPIANVVRAFILYRLSIVASIRPSWLLALLGYYLLFELNLRLRPMTQQI